MRWLSNMVRVIGQVVGITPRVGHAPQTQDSLIGGNNNTVVSKPQPVSQESKRKRSRVQQDTQAQLHKTETSSVRTHTKKSSTVGTQLATPAPKPAKSKQKQEAKVAQPTTQGKSRKLAQKAVQAERGVSGKQSKPTAHKTHQHVKQAHKRKP